MEHYVTNLNLFFIKKIVKKFCKIKDYSFIHYKVKIVLIDQKLESIHQLKNQKVFSDYIVKRVLN